MKVSVLINSFNYGSFIEKTILSVLGTYNNLEVVVYDDGSTDDSQDILYRYKDEVKYIMKDNYKKYPNENQANAIYQAFLKSTGEIICLLDSDDMFAPNKIQKISEVFKRNPDITTVQNLMLEMDEKGTLKNEVRPIIKNVTDIKSYIFEQQNFFHLFVPTSGLSFRREFLERVLPLEEDGLNYVWPDARLSLLSVFYGKTYTIKEPLTYYRIHGTNDSNARGTAEGHQQYLKQVYKYFNKLANLNELPSLELSKELYLENTYFAQNLNAYKIEEFVRDNENIVIWGSGEAGQSILYFIKKKGLTISHFIDANIKRVGEINMGVEVLHPEIREDYKYIISPIHAYESIKGQLISKGLIEGKDFINPYKEHSC